MDDTFANLMSYHGAGIIAAANATFGLGLEAQSRITVGQLARAADKHGISHGGDVALRPRRVFRTTPTREAFENELLGRPVDFTGDASASWVAVAGSGASREDGNLAVRVAIYNNETRGFKELNILLERRSKLSKLFFGCEGLVYKILSPLYTLYTGRDPCPRWVTGLTFSRDSSGYFGSRVFRLTLGSAVIWDEYSQEIYETNAEIGVHSDSLMFSPNPRNLPLGTATRNVTYTVRVMDGELTPLIGFP